MSATESPENPDAGPLLGLGLSYQLGVVVARALVKAYAELNEIRARDGVPYTYGGHPSCVDREYFSSVVDEVDAAVKALTGKSAHCHPLLYSTHNARAKAETAAAAPAVEDVQLPSAAVGSRP